MKVIRIEIASSYKNGLYVEVSVEKKLANRLYKLVKSLAPSNAKLLSPDKYHVTVAYSRKTPVGAYKPKNGSYPGVIENLELWDSNDSYEGSKIIVAKLDSLALRAYWKLLKDRHKLSWDYPDYTPHITLMSGSLTKEDLTSLKEKLIGTSVMLTGEHAEELDEEKPDVPD